MSAEPAEVVRRLEGAQERIGEFSWRRWAQSVLASLRSDPTSEHPSRPGHATDGVARVEKPEGATEGAASGGLGR